MGRAERQVVFQGPELSGGLVRCGSKTPRVRSGAMNMKGGILKPRPLAVWKVI